MKTSRLTILVLAIALALEIATGFLLSLVYAPLI